MSWDVTAACESSDEVTLHGHTLQTGDIRVHLCLHMHMHRRFKALKAKPLLFAHASVVQGLRSRRGARIGL